MKKKEKDLHKAFEREALPHLSSLYSTALYLTKSPEKAEDLVQDAMLKAFRFWHRYEEGTNCKAWLFRIMTNTFINGTRKKHHLVESLDATPYEYSGESLSDQVSYYNSPDETFLKTLFPEEVQAAINQLPDSFRIPVVLADLNDFSYKEIADIMDCPVGTVMSRLSRGRKRLQEKLFSRAIELGIIDKSLAMNDAGTISLESYRENRKVSSP